MMDTDHANRSLLLVSNIFDAVKLPLIITAGALLGIIRENRLLPWDHDIDLWTLSTSPYADITKVMEQLPEQNFVPWEIYKTPSGKIIHWTFHRGGINICFKILHPTKDEKFMCATGIFWGRRKGVTLILIPRHFVSPPAEIEFLGRRFLAPNPPEKYLETQYGNWKVPVRDTSWLSSRSWEVHLAKECILSPWEDIFRIDMPARIEDLKRRGKYKDSVKDKARQ